VEVKMLQSEIQRRDEKLSTVKAHLKEQFVGIDDVIDKLIDRIRIWYIAEDLLQRPTIVNLFGMTGSGKTDLVNRLVGELEMGEWFGVVEFGKNARGVQNAMAPPTIEETLKSSSITPNHHGILLVDEFHRNTVGYGNELGVYGLEYPDLWNLLSDGLVSNHQERIRQITAWITTLRNRIRQESDPAYQQMIEMMMRTTNPDFNPKAFIPKSNTSNSIMAEYIPRYINVTDEDCQKLLALKALYATTTEEREATFFNDMVQTMSAPTDIRQKEQFFSTLPNEILLLYLEQKLDQVKNAVDDDEKRIFRKLLIIVCGNLDNLFIGKNMKEDADELYKKTTSITTTDVRNELLNIFRPEMVSRLGDNYIVSHSLSERGFKNIVKRETEKIFAKVAKKYPISYEDLSELLNPDELFEMVRKRGFFPSQGVRPVISQVNAIVGEKLPEFLMKYTSSMTTFG
jgi:cell division protease FtsH